MHRRFAFQKPLVVVDPNGIWNPVWGELYRFTDGDDLRCCGPPAYWPLNYPDSNQRTMIAPEPSHHPKVPAHIGHSSRGGRLLPILIGSPAAVAIVSYPTRHRHRPTALVVLLSLRCGKYFAET
jgi:hypothetical protein